MRPPVLGPVTFEDAREGFRARLVATIEGRQLQIVARCSPVGTINDLQATGPNGEFNPGTAGSPELDTAIREAIELAYAAARNASVVSNALWRERRSKRRTRSW
jgi:hypothetical protein